MLSFKRVDWILAGILAASASLAGCAFQLEKVDASGAADSGAIGGDSALLASEVPDFDTVSKQVLRPACTSCHGTQEPILLTYDQVVANLDDIEHEVFVEKSMPKGRTLSRTHFDLLKRWMDAGAPRTVAPKPTPSVSPDPSSASAVARPVRFAVVREKVLDVSCNSCHYPDNSDGITDLTTYAGAKSSPVMLMGTTLVRPIMPPTDTPGVDPLTQEQKDLLALWFADGMQD